MLHMVIHSVIVKQFPQVMLFLLQSKYITESPQITLFKLVTYFLAVKESMSAFSFKVCYTLLCCQSVYKETYSPSIYYMVILLQYVKICHRPVLCPIIISNYSISYLLKNSQYITSFRTIKICQPHSHTITMCQKTSIKLYYIKLYSTIALF